MIDAVVAFGDGPHLVLGDQAFTIVKAGILNDEPYAEIAPENTVILRAVLENIRLHMPNPISIQEIQMELSNSF